MTDFTGARRLPRLVGGSAGANLLLWAAVASAAACTAWLGEGVVIVAFAGVSWLALRAFPVPHRRGSLDRPLVIACMLSVPLQYGFVAAHAYELFVSALPLATLMVLPMLALWSGNTRDLLDRIAERGFVVMLCVYCVAHAPALLMLGTPSDAARNGLLVAFLVIAAHVGDGVRALFARLRSRRSIAGPARGWLEAQLPATAVVGVLTGMAFAPAMPVSTPLAAAIGAGIASVGWLGSVVLARLRADAATAPAHTATWPTGIARPDALCFAAPVFFHLMRAF